MSKFNHAIIGLSLLLGAALESPAQILKAVQLINDQPLLASVTSIEISPDGRHLYSVSPAAQQISAYARDAQTGALSLIDNDPYATSGNTSGQFGSQASLFHNAQFLLLGSLFGNGRDLAIFQRGAATGALTLLGSLDALGQTNSQAAAIFSMDGMSLFYRSDTGSDPPNSAIGSLSREQSNGLIGFAGETSFGGIKWKDVDDALTLAANDRLILTSKQNDPTSDQSIIIVKPSDGAGFEPGSMLAFSIQGKDNFDIQSVLLFSKEFGMEIDQPPFSGQVEIPVHLLGEVHLHAIAKDFAGNMTSAESITIYIKTDLDLLKLDVITGDVILLDASKIKKVGVSGKFSDGITRDITNDPDTIYSITDKSIATVSVDGMVTPVSNGHTTLRVENSGVQDTVSVIVSKDTP